MSNIMLFHNLDGSYELISTYTSWQTYHPPLLKVDIPKVYPEKNILRKKNKKSVKKEE